MSCAFSVLFRYACYAQVLPALSVSVSCPRRSPCASVFVFRVCHLFSCILSVPCQCFSLHVSAFAPCCFSAVVRIFLHVCFCMLSALTAFSALSELSVLSALASLSALSALFVFDAFVFNAFRCMRFLGIVLHYLLPSSVLSMRCVWFLFVLCMRFLLLLCFLHLLQFVLRPSAFCFSLCRSSCASAFFLYCLSAVVRIFYMLSACLCVVRAFSALYAFSVS